MHKRIAVIGSRDYKHLQDVVDYIYSLPPNTTIVSGGARGVDKTAENVAIQRGLLVDIYKADWDKLGKQAGFLRNVDIVKNCEEVVAFWDGMSRGTLHTINLTKKYHVPLIVYTEIHRYNDGPTLDFRK